jgi:hypothetical protein
MALAFTIDEKRLYLYKRKSKPLYIAQIKNGIYYSSRYRGLLMAGFKNVIECPDDEILGFEDGRLVDHRYYGEPEIVMPCDTSPVKWRSFDFKKIIPYDYKMQQDIRAWNKSTNTIVIPPVVKKLGNETSLNEITPGKNKKWDHNRFIKKFKSSKDLLGIKISSGGVQEAESDGEKSYVIASLEEAGSEEKLSLWNVFLDISPYSTITRSSEDGICVMEHNETEPVRCRVIAVPPDTEEAYYSKEIVLNPSSVLEVTLSLMPFQETKEWKELESKKKNGKNSGSGSEDRNTFSYNTCGDTGDNESTYCWGLEGEDSECEGSGSIEAIDEFLGESPVSIFYDEESPIAYFKDFEKPFVAEEIFREIFKGSEKSTTKYQLAMFHIENLEQGTEDFLGKSYEELDLHIRNRLMTPLMEVLDCITTINWKGMSSIFIILGEQIHSEPWWKVYNTLRTLVIRHLKEDLTLLEEVCDSLGLTRKNRLTTPTIKSSEIGDETFSVKKSNGEYIETDDEDVIKLNNMYLDIISETLTAFWEPGNPIEEESPRAVFYMTKEVNSRIKSIVRELSDFTSLLRRITKKSATAQTARSIAEIESSLSTLERIGSSLDIASSTSEFMFDGHDVDSVSDLWGEAVTVISGLYETLGIATDKVNDEVIPF